MVTRNILKEEIDKVQEVHLTALYNIIKNFELPIGTIVSDSNITTDRTKIDDSSWKEFIQETYGCLKDDPIKRAAQGEYEIREMME